MSMFFLWSLQCTGSRVKSGRASLPAQRNVRIYALQRCLQMGQKLTENFVTNKIPTEASIAMSTGVQSVIPGVGAACMAFTPD